MKNLLLLSGSRAAGNLPADESPGFLDWAEDWIKAHFREGPVLFVPYARPGGISRRACSKTAGWRARQVLCLV